MVLRGRDEDSRGEWSVRDSVQEVVHGGVCVCVCVVWGVERKVSMDDKQVQYPHSHSPLAHRTETYQESTLSPTVVEWPTALLSMSHGGHLSLPSLPQSYRPPLPPHSPTEQITCYVWTQGCRMVLRGHGSVQIRMRLHEVKSHGSVQIKWMWARGWKCSLEWM